MLFDKNAAGDKVISYRDESMIIIGNVNSLCDIY